MEEVNKIFSNQKLIQANSVQKIKYNREHLITKDVAQELNTYLNFGVFPVYADTMPAQYEQKGKDWVRTAATSKAGTPGVRSLFNRAGAVLLGSVDGNCQVDVGKSDAHYWRLSNNVPLLDTPANRIKIRQSSGCSVKELVQASSAGLMGQETYAYSDFMYCKHLGKVSNNYMITLRRFPFPVDDFIGTTGLEPNDRTTNSSKNASAIGCMVTWMGVSGNDLSTILKYSVKMPFKEQESENQQNQQDADQNQTILNGLFSIFDNEYREQYQAGYADVAANGAFKMFGFDAGNAPYTQMKTFEDRNKVYGPIDAIKKTYIRASEGLTFDQQFTLVFEYELRAYNGINPKQAMLDLISNILNVVYTTGTFWGGGFKGFGAHQSNIFANLNIFKARGGFTNFVDAFSEDISTLGETFGARFKDENGEFSWKSTFQELNNLGGMIMSGMLNKLGRPQKTFYNSLLSPAPIGFWHVTIGNPKRPIMSIGNMIITDCQIEHNGPLGLDDFPTGLKVSVTLNRGKPRDLRDIEKLYMQGNDRIYTSMGDKVFDMYKNSELYKAHRNNLNEYKPVSDIADITHPADSKSSPTIDLKEYADTMKTIKKYFGTTDTYSVYVPATEQEYGAGKKKPDKDPNASAPETPADPPRLGDYRNNNENNTSRIQSGRNNTGK